MSRRPFGEAGPKFTLIHEGHEVQFCCTGCLSAFLAHPDPHMARIKEAALVPAATSW